MSLLAPKVFTTIGLTGALSANNRLYPASSTTLALSGSYAGVPYVMNGPAFVGSVPFQLGLKPGDRVKLTGALGTELNHGRDLTIMDPATLTVLEALAFPDPDEYEFTAYRRSPGTWTLNGRDALARLFTWSAFDPDVAYTALRPRWVGLGNDGQPESEGVIRLASSLPIVAGTYLRALDSSVTVFPTLTSGLVKALFTSTEITYALAGVLMSEAGLFFDAMVAGVSSVDPTLPGNAPAIYESFEPLAKLDSFTLEVTWELQF